MFVACFCLCELCLSRDCMYFAFTRARADVRESEREITLEREGVGARQILLQKKFDKKERNF